MTFKNTFEYYYSNVFFYFDYPHHLYLPVREKRMKPGNAALIFLILIFPLFVSGQEDYSEMANVMNKLISYQKSYIASLESAKKSEDISVAMKELGNNLKELATRF